MLRNILLDLELPIVVALFLNLFKANRRVRENLFGKVIDCFDETAGNHWLSVLTNYSIKHWNGNDNPAVTIHYSFNNE